MDIDDSICILCSQSKKRKLLKWFEEVFVRVSGEDQPIQVDQLATAIHADNVSKWLTLSEPDHIETSWIYTDLASCYESHSCMMLA